MKEKEGQSPLTESKWNWNIKIQDYSRDWIGWQSVLQLRVEKINSAHDTTTVFIQVYWELLALNCFLHFSLAVVLTDISFWYMEWLFDWIYHLISSNGIVKTIVKLDRQAWKGLLQNLREI